MQKQELAGGKRPDRPQEPIRRRSSIFVIEDDERVRDAITSLLTRNGFAVVALENGWEALARMQASAPAVVLLDLELPLVDGWEVRRRMLADPLLAKVPCVVITAGLDPKAYLVPADMMLFKPLQEAQLLRIVEHYAATPDAARPPPDGRPRSSIGRRNKGR